MFSGVCIYLCSNNLLLLELNDLNFRIGQKVITKWGEVGTILDSVKMNGVIFYSVDFYGKSARVRPDHLKIFHPLHDLSSEKNITKSTNFQMSEVNSLRGYLHHSIQALFIRQFPPRMREYGWIDGPIITAEMFNNSLSRLPLKLKENYCLHSLLFISGGNGYGEMWAVPTNHSFSIISTLRTQLDSDPKSKPKKPKKALANMMLAFEGDNSAYSYLTASLLFRELNEIHRRWHDIDWNDKTIIDKYPWKLKTPIGKNSDWTMTSIPKQWAPAYFEIEGERLIQFYSYTGRGYDTVFHNIDRYSKEDYDFDQSVQVIGRGRQGFIY